MGKSVFLVAAITLATTSLAIAQSNLTIAQSNKGKIVNEPSHNQIDPKTLELKERPAEKTIFDKNREAIDRAEKAGKVGSK